jgi:hypothetical protein
MRLDNSLLRRVSSVCGSSSSDGKQGISAVRGASSLDMRRDHSLLRSCSNDSGSAGVSAKGMASGAGAGAASWVAREIP